MNSSLDILLQAEEKGISLFLEEGKLRFALAKGKSVDPDFLQLLKSQKAAITAFLQSEMGDFSQHQGTVEKISTFDRTQLKHIPLSYAQERLWFLDQLEGTQNYHIPKVLRFKGNLDVNALAKAFTNVVDRHEVLRSVYREDEGKAYQQIVAPGQWHMQQTKKNLDEEQLQNYIQEAIQQPFQLAEDHPLRVQLLEYKKEEYILIMVLHHIAADGWSMSILMEELFAAYQANVDGASSEFSALLIQYTDYAYWQKSEEQQEKMAQKLAYWENKLAGVEPLNLSTDFPRPAIQSTKGQTYGFSLDSSLYQQLTQLARSQGVTLFMLLLSVYKVLLYKYTGQKDICVGTPTANRPLKELESLIGFFINSLALRSSLDGNIQFDRFLQTLKQETLTAFDHQEVPFERVVDRIEKARDRSRSPIFQTFFVLQNTPGLPESELEGLTVEAEDFDTDSSKFDLQISAVEAEQCLQIEVEYCSDLFKQETIEQLMGYYQNLLQEVVKQPSAKIGELQMLTKKEQTNLIESFNKSWTEFAAEDHIIALFEKQVAETPENVALVFQNQELTYATLNERANQLAHFLRAQGVSSGSMVGICRERSAELVIGLLAILKAGATYVPIDPKYPQERVQYILEDAKIQYLIADTANADLGKTIQGLELIVPEEHVAQISEFSTDNPGTEIDAAQLAYIIYTSGSTGKPKGVMITHGNVSSFVQWCHQEFAADDFEVVYHATSVCFDLSVYEIFYTLSTGKYLRVLESALSIRDWLDKDQKILLNTVPSVIKSLLEEQVDFSNVSHINMAGEPIPVWVKNNLDLDRIVVRNLYGPSEDTTYSTFYRLEKDQPILIGKPIANTEVYLVDEDMNLVPQGAIGELCLSGEGVAAGYLYRPELTQEKFIENPFSDRPFNLYKTGDLARWRTDGNLEFLGRKDTQVKVRGYRIELKEIEAVLQEQDMVNQAVVLAKEDQNGNKRLVAYIIPSGELDQAQLQQNLKTKLPAYMVPTVMLEMEAFPLTPNGKIDKKSLPNPEQGASLSTTYVAPGSIVEETLAEIWQEVLGINQVGIHDNFFELGGDSIITIQVVSRARRMGYFLKPADVFECQNIAELAQKIVSNNGHIKTEQGLLSGGAPLLPIQQYFFDQQFSEASHYNQSLLLTVDKTISSDQVQNALLTLMNQHDALRFAYTQTDTGWTQAYTSTEFQLDTADLSGIEVEDCLSSIETLCSAAQQGLAIEKGELIKALWIEMPEAAAHNRLFLVIHHLAVDGVSWRILLDQLNVLLQQQIAGVEMDLGQKTSSYRQWAEALTTLAQSPGIEAQTRYWSKAISSYQALPVDKAVDGVVYKDRTEYNFTLGKTKTKELLSKANHRHQTRVEEFLLAVLAQTISSWAGHSEMVIGLEGHGRENLFDDLDTSSTIGWFTSLYPLSLSLPNTNSPDDLLKSVKEQIRAIPDKGMSYGMLKYLHPSVEIKEQLAGAKWDIVFNYLGQLDNVIAEDSLIDGADEDTGANISLQNSPDNKFEISAIIVDGQLTISWKYALTEYHQSTIEKLAADFQANLTNLIDYCTGHTARQFSPSDFGLAPQVSFESLDAFLNEKYNNQPLKDQISEVYRLGPMQEGMLFHGLYDENSSAYTEQISFDFPKGLNVDHFQTAWNLIVQDHSILRTAFYADALEVPVQAVFNSVSLPVQVLDYSALDSAEKAKAIDAFMAADLEQGFDFKEAPLMRLHLIKLDEVAYKMVWTFHHILLDGWSLPIIIGSMLRYYEALAKGTEVPVGAKDDYRSFIQYIAAKDKYEEADFWKSYLNGLESPSILPFVPGGVERNKGNGEKAISDLLLDETIAEAVREYAQQNRITVNTLIQGIWALLLARYNGAEHAAFGVTVSGRPADLENAENKAGLFINTIPLFANMSDEQPVKSWLQGIQDGHTKAREFQYTPLNTIQQWAGINGEFFDSILIFENYPLGEVVEQEWTLEIDNVKSEEQTNYLLSVVVSMERELLVKFNYNASLLSAEAVHIIQGHFEQVLRQIVVAEVADLKQISLVHPIEEKRIFEEFNNTSKAYPTDKTLMELFEDRVLSHPDKTALIFDEAEMTYKELDERANQFANCLLSQGVTPGANVGILANRSFEMIIGIWGILKCGGTYVPLHSDYPSDRIKYILEDTQCQYVVHTHPDLVNKIEGGNYHFVDLQELDGFPTSSCGVSTTLDDLAYVLYTSGTTGQPKGILISQRNVLKLVFDNEAFSIHANDRVLQWSTFAFDGSVYDIFCSLLNGATLCLIEEDQSADPQSIGALIKQHKLTKSFLTTALFNAFVEYDLEALNQLDKVLFGGEKVSIPHVKKAFDTLGPNRIIHVYGPTENTVYSTFYPIQNCNTGFVPIGRPLDNTQAYVVNTAGQLAGVGEIGELWLAGDGMSRGYLNRPELTAEKFIRNPFSLEPARIYRSGDLVRWLPDGSIDFVGRKDAQIKMRGYRIELGEIESAIQQCDGVKRAIVLLNQDSQGTKRLVAYLVTDENYQEDQFRATLSRRLPGYMVPAVFIQLEELPLTTNGKIDKRALPAPEEQPLSKRPIVAPNNEIEKNLLQVWQELLDADQLSIHDNFFEVGGDSIVTIQLASRAKKFGYQLQPRDIFENPTIAALAYLIQHKDHNIEAEQGLLDGKLGLLPIQEWFFQLDYAEQAHFNQAALFEIDKSFSAVVLDQAVQQLVAQHDALRMAFREEAGTWNATYTAIQGTVQEVSLTAKDSDVMLEEIKQTCTQFQKSLNLDSGEVARFIWMQTPEFEEKNRLFIVIHHLVVDGVSWRIILHDLQLLLDQLSKNQEVELGAKSSSYRQWQKELHDYANSNRVSQQLNYWEKVVNEYQALPTDKSGTKVYLRDIQSETVVLDKEMTTALLQEANQSYQTEINDLLLAALAKTVTNWSAQEKLIIGLEGHGREDLFSELDVSNTVGWFTNLYPVCLESQSSQNPREWIIATKEQLRTIPQKGMGFGLLRYMHNDERVRQSLSAARWDVIFNYLGQFDNVATEDGILTGAEESIGSGMAENFPYDGKLIINGLVSDGQLQMTFAYSEQQYEAKTIQQLSTQFILNLEQLIHHCTQQENVEFTPSDYGLQGKVGVEELEEFMQDIELEGEEILKF